MKFDAFVSHATEDKATFVQEFVRALQGRGLEIWYDIDRMTVGDSLRQSIDSGIISSRFGIVVLSEAFFRKPWANAELDGLMAKQMSGAVAILPIWHNITRDDLMKYSPFLVDKIGLSSGLPLDVLVQSVVEVVRTSPHVYPQNFTPVPENTPTTARARVAHARPRKSKSGSVKKRKPKGNSPHKSNEEVEGDEVSTPDPREWHVSVLSPAPLGKVNSQFSYQAFSAVYGLRTSAYQVTFDALVPQNLGGLETSVQLANPQRVRIVHMHAKKVSGGLVVEGADFSSHRVSIESCTEAMQLSSPDAIILSGSPFQDLARHLAQTLNVPVWFTTRAMQSDKFDTTISGLYRRLFAGGLGVEPRVSDQAFLGVAFPPSGMPVVTGPATGSAATTENFERMRIRAANSRLRVHGDSLGKIYSRLDSRNVIEVFAPKGSGVSTTLGILSDYMNVDTLHFHHGAVEINLEKYSTIEQILKYVGGRLEITSNSFFDLITKHTIAFCVDESDENPAMAAALLEEIARAGQLLRSPFVFGVEEPRRPRASVAIELLKLTPTEQRLLLSAEIGSLEASKFAPALTFCMPRPNAIYELVSLIRSGKSLDAVCEILQSGQTAVVAEIADSVARKPALRPILRTLCILGPDAPMSLVEQILESELASQGHRFPPLAVAEMIEDLTIAGLVRKTSADGYELARRDGLDGETYLSLDRGVFERLREIFSLNHSDNDAAYAERLSVHTLAWVRSTAPTISSDGGWLTAAAAALHHWKHWADLSALAMALIVARRRPDGTEYVPLREGGAADDLRELLKYLKAGTLLDGPQWLHERCLLFFAETCYKLNEIADAVAEFSVLAESDEANPNLSIRANRALGQIAFRSGDYEAASRYYTTARSVAQLARPSYQLTLNVEEAKLLIRWGLPEEAGTLLKAARGLLDAKAEGLGPILLAEGDCARIREDYDGARVKYEEAVRASESNEVSRAMSCMWLILIARNGSSTDGEADRSSVVVDLMQQMKVIVEQSPGHVVVGVLAEFIEATSPDGDRTSQHDLLMGSISSRLLRSGHSDLLNELEHAYTSGPTPFVVDAPPL